MEKKFKFYCKELGMTEPFSMNDLKSSIIRNCDAYDKCLQYLGYSASERELYEGDVIELVITDKLMDIHKDGFAGSNMGKYVKESIAEGEPITSIICAIEPESNTLTTGYKIYCLRNGKIKRDLHGELEVDSSSYNDGYFPQYLAAKGAVCIGNIVESPDIVQKRGDMFNILMNEFYVTMESVEDMIAFAEVVGAENIQSKYEVEEAYYQGFLHCLVNKDTFEFKLIHWMKADGDYHRMKFEDFIYSDFWQKIKETRGISDGKE